MDVNGDTVVGDDVKIGALNDGLFCVGRQDAHQKHCRRQESQQTNLQPVHGDPPPL
jgi:hypothetical protein